MKVIKDVLIFFISCFQSVEKLTEKIADLDEKANSLDKRRTQTIAAISYINERNRKNNVEKAEKAIMVSYVKPVFGIDILAIVSSCIIIHFDSFCEWK